MYKSNKIHIDLNSFAPLLIHTLPKIVATKPHDASDAMIGGSLPPLQVGLLKIHDPIMRRSWAISTPKKRIMDYPVILGDSWVDRSQFFKWKSMVVNHI